MMSDAVQNLQPDALDDKSHISSHSTAVTYCKYFMDVTDGFLLHKGRSKLVGVGKEKPCDGCHG